MRRDHEGSWGPDHPESDSLAEDAPLDGRAVHPYRDPRVALIARRRALARELAEAERAAARSDRIARALRVIDQELAAEEHPAVESITVPTRCRASWRDMRGEGAVRRCPRCDRDVYDLGIPRAKGHAREFQKKRDADSPFTPPYQERKFGRLLRQGHARTAGPCIPMTSTRCRKRDGNANRCR